MPISFPSSPVLNQIHTVGSKSWQWDGAVWVSYYNEAPDAVYGSGSDGDALLDGTNTYTSLGITYTSSVYSMTKDVYFNNLTVSSNIRLEPNGYRIFVKNFLYLNSSSVIGYVAGYSTTGSIKQGGEIDTAVSHSLGGASATRTRTLPTAAMGGFQYFTVARQAITGYSMTASGGPTFLQGGAGGVGQPGGGVVIMAARYISGPSTGTAYIKAPGVAPAGGGVIIVISSSSSLPASISTDVTGQNAGTSYYIQQV